MFSKSYAILSFIVTAFAISPYIQAEALKNHAIDLADGTWAMDAQFTNGAYRCDKGVADMKISDDGATFSFVTTSGKTNKARVVRKEKDYLVLKYNRAERSAGGPERRDVIMYFLDENSFVWIAGAEFSPRSLSAASAPRIRCRFDVS